MSELPDDALEPVNREPTAAIVADQLRRAIMRGAFPPGSQLGEVELAGRLGVSRGPLREAMQRLVAEGLVRAERHRGLFVVDLDLEDVRDVYVARLTVEQAAARRILRAPDRTVAIAELERAQRAIVAAAASGDLIALGDADQEFHATLVRVAGSPRLERMAQTLLTETRMCLAALQQTNPRPAELVLEHAELLDAVRLGDERALLRLLDEHMSAAVSRIEADIVDPDPDDVALAR